MSETYYDRFVPALPTPENVTLSVVGTAGSTTYVYQVAAYNWNGETLACSTVTVTTGNGVLSTTNYNRLVWTITDGAYGYCVFGRTSGGSYGLLLKADKDSTGFVTVSSTQLGYNDQGQHTPDTGVQPATANTTERQTWDTLLFRTNKAIQGAELNEMQSVQDLYHTKLCEYLFQEGYVVQGCTPTIQTAGTVILDPGRVYIKGKIREIAGGTVTITGSGQETIGLLVTEVIATHLTDTALTDPAVGSYNYEKDGAHRRIYTFAWVANNANAVKVYDVQDGGVIVASQSTSDAQIGKVLAQRTYEESGSYSVDPTSAVVKEHETDATKMCVSVSAMRAYVFGYRVERSRGTTLTFDRARDTKNVPEEQFTKSTPIDIYKLSEEFVSSVNTLYATVKITGESVTRGPVGGGQDELSHTPVVGITTVWDGGATYTEGVDFIRDGNNVDWSPGGSEPSIGTSYFVTYTYRKTMIKGTRTRTLVTDEVVARTALSTDNLAHGDVINIVQIADASGSTTADYTLDVDYYLENGQGDLAISNGKVNWSPPSGHEPTLGDNYYVTYYYWAHTTEGEFVCSDSYDKYDYIGTYGSKNLRDCIDFRCTGGATPEADNVNVDYNFYLPRCDLICINTNGMLSLVKGTSDENPQPPAALDGTMSIFELYVGPYTYGVDDVIKTSLEVVRSTMADIKALAQRINTLEYFNALDQLEKEAENTYTVSLKSGVLTDNFGGSARADIDFNKGGIEFTAAFKASDNIITVQTPFINYDITNYINQISSSVAIGSKVISLPYTEELEAIQPLASQAININPYNVFAWIGSLKLTPESDNWVDTEVAPALTVSSGPSKEELSTWSAVQGRGYTLNTTAWTEVAGSRRSSVRNMGWGTITTNTSQSTRRVTTLSLQPETETKSIGDRVVATSISPFMRSRWVVIEGHKLRPSTEVECTMDDTTLSLVAIPPTTGSGGKVTTDSSGHFKAQVLIPAGTFHCGQSEIKVFNDVATQYETEATATYTASGLQETRQQTYISVTTLQPKVTVNTETRQNVSTATQVWSDPVAETLLFSESFFMTAVGLYFKTKDSSIPLTVEFRTVENGYPGQHTIASKTIYPADINVSEDGSVETKVIFDDICFIEANKEICIALIANSDNYNVWIATMGGNDTVTGQMVTKQPYDGVLFKSPNATTWVADANSDLKFKIYRADFSLTGTLLFNSIPDANGTIVFLNATNFNPGDYEDVTCNNLWQVDAVAVTDNSPILTNLETSYFTTNVEDVYLRCLLESDSSRYSPTINMERMNLIVSHYQTGTATYISRNADLSPNDFNNLKFILEEYNPSGTTTDVYYSLDDGYTWTLLTSADLVSTSQMTNEYTEYTWVVTFVTDETQFRARIDLKTNNTAATPSSRRLRCIAY